MTMEVNVTTTKIEQEEMNGIDGTLHTLWKQKLLTDFDCRIIASSNTTLMEKKAAVYTALVSKSKKEASILIENFRKMTKTIHSKKKSIPLQNTTNNDNEENNCSILQSRNPFLIDPIITNLIGFLSLEDIKRSRLVCHQWNSTAELCLRKRSAIQFRNDTLLPYTFMEVSKYSHPDHPFSSFVFSTDEENEGSSWQISKIEDFFAKWGKNIKELTFRNISLTKKCNLTDGEIVISDYDVTPLFINPSNITSLKIKFPYLHDDPNSKTTFDISLEKFVSIKTLSLNRCRLIASAENESTQIAPLSVDFINVRFVQNGEIVTHLYDNDLIDFSKAVNINLDNQFRWMGLKLDNMVFHLKQLHLSHVPDDSCNWSHAKGDVQFLRLNNSIFEERSHLKIMHLQSEYCKVDLSALPETLETLKCVDGEIICSERLYLPNLKHLSISAKTIDVLAYFSNCPLMELEISSSTSYYTFNLSHVPKSVKTLKMEIAKVEFTGNCNFELDTLIFTGKVYIPLLRYCKAITAQIKAKVLVVVSIDTSSIVRLVLTYKQTEKILCGSFSDWHKGTFFEGSELSNYVDKESNFYQFENKVGKSITEAEFERYANMNVYCPPFFYST